MCVKVNKLKEQFLAKKAEAEIVNNIPDNQDMQRVTGFSLEDFGTTEAAISAYQFGMDCLFQAGDKFAVRCTLFANLLKAEPLTAINSIQD